MDAPQAPVISVPNFTSKELSAAATSLHTVKVAGTEEQVTVQTSVANAVAAAVGTNAI